MSEQCSRLCMGDTVKTELVLKHPAKTLKFQEVSCEFLVLAKILVC
jgi:hypothetical protein